MFIVYSKKDNHTRASRMLKNRKQVEAEIQLSRKDHPECLIRVVEVTQLWEVNQQGEWQLQEQG